MFKYFNPNPSTNAAGDCVIRMLCCVTGKSWEECYKNLCDKGLYLYDIPSANRVWMSYLMEDLGFYRDTIYNVCPVCYTVKDFCKEFNQGLYILATGSHVLTVIDGDYYDSWDSGNESPILFFTKN